MLPSDQKLVDACNRLVGSLETADLVRAIAKAANYAKDDAELARVRRSYELADEYGRQSCLVEIPEWWPETHEEWLSGYEREQTIGTTCGDELNRRVSKPEETAPELPICKQFIPCDTPGSEFESRICEVCGDRKENHNG